MHENLPIVTLRLTVLSQLEVLSTAGGQPEQRDFWPANMADGAWCCLLGILSAADTGSRKKAAKNTPGEKEIAANQVCMQMPKGVMTAEVLL